MAKPPDRDTGEPVKPVSSSSSSIKTNEQPEVAEAGKEEKQKKASTFRLFLSGLFLPRWEEFFDEFKI